MTYASEAQICREAIGLQDACNFSGVALTLHEMARGLRCLGVATGRHPALILTIDKLRSLIYSQTFTGEDMDQYSSALLKCRKIAEEVHDGISSAFTPVSNAENDKAEVMTA